MPKKAFTMTSTKYCGACGSFDLVKTNPGVLSRFLLGLQPQMRCYGCDNRFDEVVFSSNALRTIPVSVDDFFFQTRLRNQQVQGKPIRPVTQCVGLGLIVGTVAYLVFYTLPDESSSQSSAGWVSLPADMVAAYESDVVKSLQQELKALIKTE
ncbi:MAG: hypothetical protein ACPG47_03210 [Leucothrix sp.]